MSTQRSIGYHAIDCVGMNSDLHTRSNVSRPKELRELAERRGRSVFEHTRMYKGTKGIHRIWVLGGMYESTFFWNVADEVLEYKFSTDEEREAVIKEARADMIKHLLSLDSVA